ncbi:hypothetical protein PVK06_002219 [Gossypium arboreum]|uniref:Uncharacterized protein n=1 Tax=Gossypium arboreum TaxID=29729 RepID=A0ABR0R441_GOSAR|nr:hypothetical protein PVK06_002219 [Gossypium arboreum]
MSCKKTRSAKTAPKNQILIDEEVKERFDSIFKHQPMMSEKRLVEKVHEMNQGEQEEPTEPDNEKSTKEIETEDNLVTDTEEESNKELDSPKPVEGSTTPELRVEPKEEPIKLSVEPESATPTLTCYL